MGTQTPQGPRYRLRREDVETCEWDTFLVGEPCGEAATQAIIDTRLPDAEYPEGLHIAHLCDRHARFGLVETERDR